MPKYAHDHGDERKDTGRLEALSDGVFAIAMTLLILGVPVPLRNELKPGMTLLGLMFGSYRWLSMVTYAISFTTILVMWVNHHSMFQFLARIDRGFAFINGALLMLIVFVNYPTALVANFAGTPEATLAAVTYSTTLAVTAILYNALWRWASSGRRLLARDVVQDEVALITRQYRIGPLLYLLALGLAFVSPWLSVALNAGLALYFAFTGHIVRSHAGRDTPTDIAEPIR